MDTGDKELLREPQVIDPQLVPEGKRVGLRQGISVTEAALQAGHVPYIVHAGKRFKIVCPCGWSSSAGWTRKKAFAEVSLHALAVGRAALLEFDPDEEVRAPATSPLKRTDDTPDRFLGTCPPDALSF